MRVSAKRRRCRSRATITRGLNRRRWLALALVGELAVGNLRHPDLADRNDQSSGAREPAAIPAHASEIAGADAHARAAGKPQGQGFIAATRANAERAHQQCRARTTVTEPSSSGSRSASRTVRFLELREPSSRNSTPLCASEISPGLGMAPPPSIAAGVDLVVRRAKGPALTARRAPRACRRRSRRRWSRSASLSSSGGKIVGRRRASMPLPAPGEPMSRRLCEPAAAHLQRHSLTVCSRPRTSARSTSSKVTAAPAGRSRASAGGRCAARQRPPRRESAASTGTSASAAASAAQARGRTTARQPVERAYMAMGRPPATRRKLPSRDSSPRSRTCARCVRAAPHLARLEGRRSRSADRRRRCLFRTSAGARFTAGAARRQLVAEWSSAARTRTPPSLLRWHRGRPGDSRGGRARCRLRRRRRTPRRRGLLPIEPLRARAGTKQAACRFCDQRRREVSRVCGAAAAGRRTSRPAAGPRDRVNFTDGDAARAAGGESLSPWSLLWMICRRRSSCSIGPFIARCLPLSTSSTADACSISAVAPDS